jgi:2-polyprenyl-3-methyl-5-hydroxy-6-metoxy-1,4-benzoquinol methylase
MRQFTKNSKKPKVAQSYIVQAKILWDASKEGRKALDMGKFSIADDHLPYKNSGRHLSPAEKWWLTKFTLDFEKNRLSVVEHLVPDARGPSKALDVGCAIGVFTNLLHQKGYEALGIDTSKELLTFARNRYASCTFKLMNVLHLDLTPSTFDLVLALEVIEHLDNPYRFLKNIHQVLKEEGVILLSTPNRLSLEGAKGVAMEKMVGINWKAWDAEHTHVYTSMEIIQLLRRFFEIQGVVGYYCVPMVPCTKFDIIRRIGLSRTHYIAFDNRVLSKLGFITFVKGVKRKSDSAEQLLPKLVRGK